jgi:hypothetical protein
VRIVSNPGDRAMIEQVLYRLYEKHLLTEVLRDRHPVILDSSRTVTGSTHSERDSLTRRATATGQQRPSKF